MTTQESVVKVGSTLQSAAVDIKGVSKYYHRKNQKIWALENVNLQVEPGQFVCLLGRSGCGKSTLLNLVAGLDVPSRGTVDVGGRRVGVMFQDANLFPWLTVAGNIELALKLSKVPKREHADRVGELLETVRLVGAEKLRPHELSGGMRQRVALAKTLAQDCQILLMDEPFGALDAFTRDAMHDEIERIWQERNLTVLFVTHNGREAVRLADNVVIMATSPGRIDLERPIDISRPRAIDTAEVATVAATLSAHIRKQTS
ncbi:ABC transporter ATP-binding protein [Arthrobacter sp. Sr24]